LNISEEAIDLSRAPGERAAWGRPKIVVYLWSIVELIFVASPWQISSRLRIFVLRIFGAEIGKGVIFRPRTRVKFPWKLHIGDHCWIGEGAWFHNQDHIYISNDVVISQEAFLTTGSHRVRGDMGLITKPIKIGPGVWITSRCIVLGGSQIGASAIITPNSVVKAMQTVEPGAVFGQPDAVVLGTRFLRKSENAEQS